MGYAGHQMEHPTDDCLHTPTPAAGESLLTRVVPILLVVGLIVTLDQITKFWIRSWLELGERWPAGVELIRLTHVENRGAAFGVLQGTAPLFVAVTIVAIVVISLLIFRANSYPRWFSIGLASVLGGAIGNLLDRLARGSVTDFIDPTHYPAFNVADSAIVIGVASLVIRTLWEDSRRPGEPSGDDQAMTGGLS